MEGDHRQASAGGQTAGRAPQHGGELLQLAVDGDAQGLEAPLGRVLLFPQGLGRHGAFDQVHQLAGVAVLLMMAVVLMMGYIRLMQASHDVTVKQAQLQQAQEDNVALGVAYEKAFDQSSVKAAAQAAGMTKPTTDQIEYIELGGADMAEICRPESTGPLAQAWNWVKNGVDAVVEYFR